ncbi:hypothetical protein WDU94_012769, partial [Cyamophila willieti]
PTTNKKILKKSESKNNNQVQNKPDSPGPSTSNSPKSSQNGKPSVLLKSTPDAFYNKKTNNNVNKKDIIQNQIANGSPSQSRSSNNISNGGKQVNNDQHNSSNIRRNSDTNEHITTNRSQVINNRLRKQNSVDSNQKISGNNVQQINGFSNNSIASQTKDRVNNEISSQNSVDESNRSLNDCTILKSDGNVLSYNNNINLENGDNQIREDSEDLITNIILNGISRDVSEDNLSETASVVIKSQKSFPLSNKISDASDNDNSEDSYSITASFEIKEADNTVQNHDDTVTYLECSDKKTNENQKPCISDEKSIKEIPESREENVNEVHENVQKDDLRTEDSALNSTLSKTKQLELTSITDQDKTNNCQEINNFQGCEIGNINEEVKLDNEEVKIEYLIPNVTENSTCPSNILNESENRSNSTYGEENESRKKESDDLDYTETDYNSNGPIKTNSTEETKESIVGEVTHLRVNNNSISDTKAEEERQESKSEDIDETDKNKPKIKEEDEKEEETESEEESEEEEEEEDKKPEDKIEVKLENNITNPTNVIQMETNDVIVQPKPKIKKFVRFALIHNTYHGSDTESEEEEEDEEEEDEESGEEEEEEEEEGNDIVKDEVVPSKVEANKNVDIVQIPEPDVETVQPVDVEPELETTNAETENLQTAISTTEPEKNPFEHEKVNYENRIRDLLSEKSTHEDRIHNLISDLELKQLEQNQLKGKIGELENQVLTKTWAMDRQEAEMTSAMKESEHLRNKLRRLEDDLTEYRLKNSDLTEELVRKVAEENKRKEETCDFFKIRELEEKLYDANEKIKAFEEELNEMKRNQEIAKEAENIKKADTEVEMKIMREALDEALKQKSILQKRFESEFNQLRNVNTAQEQQLLDDFEWKLREVEQSCKKKILEADKCKRDLEAQVTKLTAEVEELSKFKNSEAELTQLRTVSHEHQRTIRTITRQKEELQV